MARSIVTPKTFLAYSLGCRTNQAEIEEISLQLTDQGLQQIGKGLQPACRQAGTTDYRLQQNTPDIVILNTCVVTQKAERETRKEIRHLRRVYPKSFLVVMGCAVDSKEKFNANLPEADLFVSNKEKNKCLDVILKWALPTKNLPDTEKEDPSSSPQDDTTLNKYHLSGRKFIKIQEGCDLFCSYCITAYLRGKPKSVPANEIIKEINYWVDKGIKEIILTGINIGLYGKDMTPRHSRPDRESIKIKNCIDSGSRPSGLSGMTIDDLVKTILSETKIERISFSSIYPEMLTKDFLKVVVGNPRITQCFHLSLQSGSSSVLKRMNRKTDLSRLKQTISRIKAENPFFTFRVDIITGFPNETEKEFKETLEFIKKTKISFAHIFPFSPREGTKAYGMIKNKKWQDLPMEIKKEREKKIMEVVKKIREEKAERMIGQLFQCLIIKDKLSHSEPALPVKNLPEKEDASLSLSTTGCEGITENGWMIRMYNVQFTIYNLKGKIVAAKITEFKNDQLLGEILSLPT